MLCPVGASCFLFWALSNSYNNWSTARCTQQFCWCTQQLLGKDLLVLSIFLKKITFATLSPAPRASSFFYFFLSFCIFFILVWLLPWTSSDLPSELRILPPKPLSPLLRFCFFFACRGASSSRLCFFFAVHSQGKRREPFVFSTIVVDDGGNRYRELLCFLRIT